MRRILVWAAAFGLSASALVFVTPAGGASEPGLAFDEATATGANGTVPTATPLGACGSPTATYLSEFLNGSPTDAKVLYHWGDIIAGKEMMVSGVARNVNRGIVDLPFDHPWSGDLTFDVDLDPAYRALGQHVGASPPGQGEAGVGQIHVELEQGQLPHVPARGGPATGAAWQDNSAAAAQRVRGEFVPRDGDRVAVMGRWVIDCGHPDFSAELHPITFMAFGRTENNKTVVHALANPFRVSQKYTPDPASAGSVSDTTRFQDPSVKPYPPFFVDEVLRLLGVGQPATDHLRAPVLVEATYPRPTPFSVCAPSGVSTAHLKVASRFVVRPGVSVNFTADRGTGCASFSTSVGPAYTAANLAARSCDMPWDWLNQQAAEAAGVSSLDVRQIIKSKIPQAFWPAVDRTPSAVCFDPLSAPSAGQARAWNPVQIRADQPFPFYGVIEVGWR